MNPELLTDPHLLTVARHAQALVREQAGAAVALCDPQQTLTAGHVHAAVQRLAAAHSAGLTLQAIVTRKDLPQHTRD